MNMYRDLGYYWLRLAIYVALGVGLATAFYDIGFGSESIEVRERFFKKKTNNEKNKKQ